MTPPLDVVREAYKSHARYLWGMAYRMTGSASEADDVVQDSFVRLQQSPPADLERSLRPWLTRVAANLCHDRYRDRQATAYPGPWLPQPVALDEGGWARPSLVATAELGGEQAGAEGVVGQRWSAAFGFLIALEALGPTQRAAFVLRELLDLSTAEAAETLGVSQSSIKVALHRARENLGGAATRAKNHTPQRIEQARGALDVLMALFAQDDLDGVLAALDEAAVLLSDGGGVVRAAMQEMHGAIPVARLMLGLSKRRTPVRIEPVLLNGHPGYDMDFAPGDAKDATRTVVLVDIATDGSGRIDRVWIVLNPAKLDALPGAQQGQPEK